MTGEPFISGTKSMEYMNRMSDLSLASRDSLTIFHSFIVSPFIDIFLHIFRGILSFDSPMESFI